jgi:glyoxylase-like metal-dependent hydrolase (beta-lactamase superfamily II)
MAVSAPSKIWSAVGSLLMVICCSTVYALESKPGTDAFPSTLQMLQQKKWIHGSADCDADADPAIEVFRYDPSTYILRQSKCLNFEAPFIYVLFGLAKVLVLDTGATENAAEFPLYETIQSLSNEQPAAAGQNVRELLVLHSHSHSDHYSGDTQFAEQPNVTLIAPNGGAVAEFFAFDDSPDGETIIDLGARKITVFAVPGHQEEAIAVYDSQTSWLLTGDTFYPGYIYVKHWNDYQHSIARLVAFSEKHEVSALLGAHIEMTDRPGEDYPIGTVHQPDEASLVLSAGELIMLNSAIANSDEQTELRFDQFIVAPMNWLQKLLSNIARWLVQ